MGQIGSILSASGAFGLVFAERLLEGIKTEMFARLARPGGQVIQSNHPAFVFGHLALYPPQVMERLGLELGATACPDHYPGLFKHGTQCQDDPDATIYPPMSELTERFFSGYRAANDAIKSAADAQFTAPNPVQGPMREIFPTVGSALGFYLGGHLQNHLGQLSAWRRATGLGPA